MSLLSPQLADTSEAVKALVKYRNDRLAFLGDLVYTEDQADSIRPVKPFPLSKPYMLPIVQEWEASPLFALVKSRRMTITWLFVALHVHIAMFNESRNVFFASRKEENSAELVDRAAFIVDHIPRSILPLIPDYKKTYLELDFPGLRSRIMGVPEGSDQLRQFGASAIFCDEFAFWQDARRAWRAMKPTIEGGARITIVSTAQQAAFFKQIIEGEL